MKTCDEIRRENLALLIKEAGSVSILAEAYGCTDAAIKTMARAYKDSKSGTPKGIGGSAARKLEACMKKEVGWLDHDQSAPRATLSEEEELLLAALPLMDPGVKEVWVLLAKKELEKCGYIRANGRRR